MAGGAVSIELTSAERDELEGLSRRRKTAQGLAHRARIVLAAAEGLENTAIAARLGSNVNTVEKWRRRFAERGLDGLHNEPGPDVPPQIDDEVIAEVIRLTRETTPPDALHWCRRSMARTVGCAPSTVHRIWRDFGLHPHRCEGFKHSSDPFFVERVRNIVGLYLAPPERALVLCLEKKSRRQALDHSQPLLCVRPEQLGRRCHDDKRHDTTSLFAALDVATLKIIGERFARHRSREFRKFLDHIETAVPEDLEIHIFMYHDDAHKTRPIRNWFAKRSRWHIHLTSTKAFWLNQVERFFGLLTENQPRRGARRSTAELEQAIADYIYTAYKDPKPFRWVKSTDHIMASIKRLGPREIQTKANQSTINQDSRSEKNICFSNKFYKNVEFPATFGIVDLFAGPGGLGEGFSAFQNRSGSCPFSIEVSIEKDPAAHATLRLRSFLRKFGDTPPAEYHEFLNGRQHEPPWSSLYPEQWAAAEHEARCMELGEEPTNRFLESRVADIHRKYGDRTILIGGPPCQAYSLVGRSRNAGIADYLPHKDDRNFLYQKYVDVLRLLEPAAFVMENVKGMLSSAIRGDLIFQRVMADLRSATGPDSYRLLALAPDDLVANGGKDPATRDFVVRMEDHGVPQARHRVIIVGLRRDCADSLPDGLLPQLSRHELPVTVGDVIGAMPRLRSGLSRRDTYDAWREAVLDATGILCREAAREPEVFRESFAAVALEAREILEAGPVLKRTSASGTSVPDSCPIQLRDWLADPNLDHLPNNDTRAHMASDLARYLFAAAFGRVTGRSPKASEFPAVLAPNHRNWRSGKFADRFRVQIATRPASTLTSHISKDGHYFIHPDPSQCRSLTVREAARLQTFPDNYFFKGHRTRQYVQVGNAVPPFLALQIAKSLWKAIGETMDDQKHTTDLPISETQLEQ